MSIVIAAQTAATSTVNVVTIAATSTSHAVQAVGNFAEAANIKSSSWLEELREDTADLKLLRAGLRQQRIAIRIATETAAIEQQIADPTVKKHYEEALKLLNNADKPTKTKK